MHTPYAPEIEQAIHVVLDNSVIAKSAPSPLDGIAELDDRAIVTLGSEHPDDLPGNLVVARSYDDYPRLIAAIGAVSGRLPDELFSGARTTAAVTIDHERVHAGAASQLGLDTWLGMSAYAYDRVVDGERIREVRWRGFTEPAKARMSKLVIAAVGAATPEPSSGDETLFNILGYKNANDIKRRARAAWLLR